MCIQIEHAKNAKLNAIMHKSDSRDHNKHES